MSFSETILLFTAPLTLVVLLVLVARVRVI
jgi:hypothetical protein